MFLGVGVFYSCMGMDVLVMCKRNQGLYDVYTYQLTLGLSVERN